jgi:hypothetical protein
MKGRSQDTGQKEGAPASSVHRRRQPGEPLEGLGYAVPTGSHGYRAHGAEEAGRNLGVKVTYIYPNQLTIPNQIETIEEAIPARANGIAVCEFAEDSAYTESVFEKCWLLRDAAEHGGGGGDDDEGFGDVGALVEVADETAVLDEPTEGALDDPSARQRLEARQGARPLDDGQDEVGLLLRPGDEPAGVSAIGEHGLDEAPEAARGAQQRLGAVAILDAAGMDLHCEQAAVGVGQDVPLAPRGLLARVVAARAPF